MSVEDAHDVIVSVVGCRIGGDGGAAADHKRRESDQNADVSHVRDPRSHGPNLGRATASVYSSEAVTNSQPRGSASCPTGRVRVSARATVFVVQPAEMRDRVDGAVAIFDHARLGRAPIQRRVAA